jgi:hypothetical protein
LHNAYTKAATEIHLEPGSGRHGAPQCVSVVARTRSIILTSLQPGTCTRRHRLQHTTLGFLLLLLLLLLTRRWCGLALYHGRH